MAVRSIAQVETMLSAQAISGEVFRGAQSIFYSSLGWIQLRSATPA